MILFGLEEFTAKRKKAQTDLEAALRPAVRHAVDLGENTRGWEDLLDLVTRLYDETYHDETGERYRGLPSGFRRELRETLRKTSHRTEASVERITIWLATAILSKVTVEGSIADPEELFLEWVTMHDPDVRHAHALTDGQVRPIGDKYDVDGTPMRHPGDSTAPIDLWINCRCTLMPVLASDALAQSSGWTSTRSSTTPNGTQTPGASTGQEPPMPRATDSSTSGASAPATPTVSPGSSPTVSSPSRRPSTTARTDDVWRSSTLTTYPSPASPTAPSGGNYGRLTAHANTPTTRPTPAGPPAATAASSGSAANASESPPTPDASPEPEAPSGESDGVQADVSVPWHGILAPEGVASGDGRMFAPNSLTNRDLPLPLTWQKASSDGHGGSVVVAKIEKIERVDNLMRASGHFIANPEADEVIGLLSEFGRFGVSVDADDATMEIDEVNELVLFTAARIASASIVAIPAFAEAYVALGLWDDEDATAPVADEVEAPAPEDVAAAKKPFPKKKVDGEEDPADPADPETPPVDGEDPSTDEEDPKKKKKTPPPMYSTATEGDLLAFAPGTEDGPGWLTNPVDTDRLRDYWVRGPGAAKIGWGVAGDFNRCRLALAKYVKPQYLNGYCANRHKDALGVWPGQEYSAADALETTEPGEAIHLVAAGGHCAPATWFTDPMLDALSAMTITDEGRVFGHLAGWATCHIGFKDTCTAPPQSLTNYAYFLTGEVALDDGTRASVGHITLGGGHAGPRMGLRAAVEHYDSTSSVVADVTMGEDDHGIWYAGWVRPGVDDDTVTALRASALSGDWRKVGGNLELVAALAVNTPGFPVPRTQVAASSQGQLSLVASGVVTATPTRADLTTSEVEAFADAVAAALEARTARRTRMAALAARMNGDV